MHDTVCVDVVESPGELTQDASGVALAGGNL